MQVKGRFSFFHVFNYALIFLVLGMLLTLVIVAYPSIKYNGFSIFTPTWDPEKQHLFGILPFLAGTFLTTFISLLFAVPLSLSLSILLGQYLIKSRFAGIFQSFLELISGIPSIIIGLWGAFFLAPFLISIIHGLTSLLPFLKKIPSLGLENPMELSIFTASFILAFMIVPFSAFLGKEAVSHVSHDLKEASYALGATDYEMVRHLILPSIRSSLIAGFLLSMGRALGETMAVTLVIGNNNAVPKTLFSPGQTMASLIANEFSEASNAMHIASVVMVGLVLFLVTMTFNIIGRIIIRRISLHE